MQLIAKKVAKRGVYSIFCFIFVREFVVVSSLLSESCGRIFFTETQIKVKY